MKTKLLLSALFSFSFCLLSSQVPQGFNYQAIARDGGGAILANTALPVKIAIQTSTGTVIYEELFSSVVTNQFGLISLVVGTGVWQSGSAPTFSAIDWKSQPLYLKTTIQYPGVTWTVMGTSQIWGVPYSLVAKDVAGPISKLGITGTTDVMDEALFEVKNKKGNTVFAVYNEGIRAYVGDGSAKGVKGGFSVGGYDASKSGTVYDIFVLSTDSARFYLDSKPKTAKGVRGGFSVGGYDMTKGTPQNYLTVSKDSVRIYLDTNPATKGVRGGFSVGGYDLTKGGSPFKNFMSVTTDSTRVYVSDATKSGSLGGFAVKPQVAASAKTDFFNVTNSAAAGVIKDESRVIWYPSKSSLLAGEIDVPSPDSVGSFSMALGFKNIAKGSYSQAMGYQSIARGNYSTAIGYQSVASTNSFAFGRSVKATGLNSFAFGAKGINASGVEIESYTQAKGDYSFAFGLGSQATNTGSFVLGTNCTSSGKFSTATGFNSTASGLNSTAMGVSNNASGEVSFAMGSGNISSGQYAFSFGANNSATGVAAIALGLSNTAGGNQSIIGGFSNTGNGFGAFAIGSYNNAQGDGSIAAGTNNQCTGVTSAAFGSGNTSSGSRSFAIGDGTIASATNSISTGYQSQANGQNSMTIGYADTTSASGAVAIGYETSARASYSVSMGYKTFARHYASFVIGRYNTYVPTTTSWNSSDQLFVAGNGSSPSAKNDALVLYKNGNMKLDGNFYPSTDNVRSLGLSTNRWTAVYAVNGTIQTSDARLKKDIADIKYGLDAILQLHPVSFRWIENSDQGVKLGLVAQEVQNVISEVVDKGDSENGTLGLRYSELIPVLIKGIQEQQKQIAEQKNVNTELLKKIDDLSKRLEQIEKSK